jgi:hypothetical protein
MSAAQKLSTFQLISAETILFLGFFEVLVGQRKGRHKPSSLKIKGLDRASAEIIHLPNPGAEIVPKQPASTQNLSTLPQTPLTPCSSTLCRQLVGKARAEFVHQPTQNLSTTSPICTSYKKTYRRNAAPKGRSNQKPAALVCRPNGRIHFSNASPRQGAVGKEDLGLNFLRSGGRPS